MNALEHYIKEVHSVEPYFAEWTKQYPDKEYVQVDVTTNCYGHIKRETRIFTTSQWSCYKLQGYWMA